MTGDRLICGICGANATSWGIGYEAPRCEAHKFNGLAPLPDFPAACSCAASTPERPYVWCPVHGEPPESILARFVAEHDAHAETRRVLMERSAALAEALVAAADDLARCGWRLKDSGHLDLAREAWEWSRKATAAARPERAPVLPEERGTGEAEMVVCPGRPEPHPRGYLCVDPVSAPSPGATRTKETP